jgi:hypothetical protein
MWFVHFNFNDSLNADCESAYVAQVDVQDGEPLEYPGRIETAIRPRIVEFLDDRVYNSLSESGCTGRLHEMPRRYSIYNVIVLPTDIACLDLL